MRRSGRRPTDQIRQSSITTCRIQGIGWLDFLCLDAPAASRSSLPEGVRRIAETLAHLDPARATYLACVAYILSRVAHVDQQVSEAEHARMAAILEEKSGLP